ncbi:MAG: DUF2806 domain-containing protein [Nitrospinae bacterium]|nr:DUF2806 domain-containing protein [Nitrospinota bacterium]
MGEDKSLVNIDFSNLSKPATVLIEKISDAIGVVYEPRKIKQLAKAEIEADKIRALGKIEVSDLQGRAMQRMIAEETIKQENIENITAQAMQELKEDAKPEDLDRDWIANLFDKCRLVSDHEMQSLWSRLLTGEANEPGTFSKRTVELVASLEKEDAHLFTKLVGFVFYIEDETCPVIIKRNNEIYTNQGLKFAELFHLNSIGLINLDFSENYVCDYLQKMARVRYFDKTATIKLRNQENNALRVGGVLLTQAGKELAPICGASGYPGFMDYVMREWQNEDSFISWE